MARLSKTRQGKIDQFADIVYKAFPKAFVSPARRDDVTYPLKIGITAELRLAYPDVEETIIEAFMKRYTNSPRYLEMARRPGMARVDLQGNVVDVMEKEQSVFAAIKLQRRREPPAETDRSIKCQETGKFRYKTALEANRVADRVGKPRRENERQAFRCSSCGSYHWGNRARVPVLEHRA